MGLQGVKMATRRPPTPQNLCICYFESAFGQGSPDNILTGVKFELWKTACSPRYEPFPYGQIPSMQLTLWQAHRVQNIVDIRIFKGFGVEVRMHIWHILTPLSPLSSPKEPIWQTSHVPKGAPRRTHGFCQMCTLSSTGKSSKLFILRDPPPFNESLVLPLKRYTLGQMGRCGFPRLSPRPFISNHNSI